MASEKGRCGNNTEPRKVFWLRKEAHAFDRVARLPANEPEPIQTRMTQLNNWIREEVLRLKPYELNTIASSI